jgi:hypothetical protein
LWVDVSIHDRVGRRLFLASKDLRRRGLPGAARLLSVEDRNPPRITSATTSGTTLDTRSGVGKLTVSIGAVDALAGVERVTAHLLPPSLDGRKVTVYLPKVAGDRHDGRWRGPVTLPACAAVSGRWWLRVVVSDDRGNKRVRRLAVAVEANDHVGPRAKVPVTAVPRTGPLAVTFDEDVAGVTTQSAVVRPDGYDRTAPGDPPAAVAGAWACTAADGRTVDCTAGPVRKASFTPTEPFPSGARYDLWLNPEHVLDLTDLHGNPYVPWLYGWTFDVQP